MKAKAVLLLLLSVVCLVSLQLASASGNLCVVGELACDNATGKAVMAVTGAVTGAGVEAAAILLAVNPWLGLGVGIAFVA
jgi:hypothetical protein